LTGFANKKKELYMEDYDLTQSKIDWIFDNSPRINAGDSPSSRIWFPASQSEPMSRLHRLKIPPVRRYCSPNTKTGNQ